MIKAIPNQIVRIQSPEAYKEEIRSKVKETFKNNIGTVVLFTALTLPMFFLAWPMALAVIFQDAKYEIDSSIANARIEFIKGLSNKLAENPNENPNTVFDTFQEENNRDFTQIFPKNVMQSDVIRLAKVFNKEGKALVLENNEVTALWKNLIQTERKITSYVSATNRFYQIIGAVDYSSDATSLNQALRDRHRAQLDLINWRDYCQPGTHLTNGQVLQKIRKDHGITLENLNLITECIVGPLTNNDLNAKREAHAEARRKVLDLLIQCPTQEKAKQFRDSLITNLWFENSPEGEQLKLFDLVLAVKFSQYFNSVNTHRDRIQESFELKKKDPALPFEGNTTWVTKEGKQIELPTWITRTEWGRRCPPIMIASNSSKKEKNAAEAAAKRSAKDVENTLTHANHFSSTEGNQQSTM